MEATLEKCYAAGLTFLVLKIPVLVVDHVCGGVDYVVSVEPGDGQEGHSLGVDRLQLGTEDCQR